MAGHKTTKTTEISTVFKRTVAEPLDKWSDLSSLTELTTELPLGIRYVGMLAYVIDLDEFYFFKGGIENIHFVKFSDLSDIRTTITELDDNKLDKGGYTGNAQDIVDLIPTTTIDLSDIRTTITELDDNKLDKGGYTGNAQDIVDLIPKTTNDLLNDKSIITINDFEEITEEGTYRIEYRSGVTYPRTNVLNLEDNSEVNFVSTFTTSGFDTELLSGWFSTTNRYSFIIDAKRVESVFEDLTPLVVPKTYTPVASYINPSQAEQSTIKQGNYTNGDVIKITITQDNFEVLRVGNPSGKDFSVDIFYQYQETEIIFFGSEVRTEVRFNPVFEDSIITITNGDINDFNVEGNYRNIFSTSLEVLGEYTNYFEDDDFIDSEDGYGGSPSYITDNTSLLKLAFPTDVVFIPQAPKPFAITGEIRFQNTNKRIGVYYSSDVNSLAFGNPIVYMDVDYIMDSELKNVYSVNQDYFIKYNTSSYDANFVEGFLEIKNIHTSLKNIGARKASLQYNLGDNLGEHIDVNCGVLLDDVENSSNFISVIEDKSGRFTNRSVFSEICVKVVFDRTLTRSNIYRTYETGKNVINIEFDEFGSHHKSMGAQALFMFKESTGETPNFTHHFAPSSKALTSKSLDYYAKKYDANVMSAPITSLSSVTPTQLPDDILLCFSLGSNSNQLERHENNWLPAQYYKNLIVVRGGVLNEKHSTTTSSWGIGTTFVEPSSENWLTSNISGYNQSQAEANESAIKNGGSIYNNYEGGFSFLDSDSPVDYFDEHNQSPASTYLTGKVKAIEKLSGINDLGVIVEAMVSTTDRNNRFIHDSLETNQYLTNYKNVLDINIDLIDIEDDFQGDDFNIVIDGVVQTSKIYNTNTINILGSELSSITEEGSYLLEVVKVTNSEVVYSQNISIWETTSFTGDYSTIDNRWNPFDGYGTVNVDNAVAWLNDTTEGSGISIIKEDGLKALKNKFEMPSVYSYEDKAEHITITKRDLEERLESLPISSLNSTVKDSYDITVSNRSVTVSSVVNGKNANLTFSFINVPSMSNSSTSGIEVGKVKTEHIPEDNVYGIINSPQGLYGCLLSTSGSFFVYGNPTATSLSSGFVTLSYITV